MHDRDSPPNRRGAHDRSAAGPLSGPTGPPVSEFFDLDAALRGVCDRAHDVLGWHVVLLMLNDESAGLCCLTAASGLKDDLKELLIGAGLGQSGDLSRWLEGHPRVSRSYVLNRLGAGTHFSLGDITGETMDVTRPEEQAVVVPLEVRGKMLGALAAYEVGATEYVSDARVRVLELLGGSAAALIDQALSESARRDLEALFSLTKALAETEELDAALGRILLTAESMLRCQAAAVLLHEEAAGELRVVAQTGFPSGVDSLAIPLSSGGPAALAVASRNSVFQSVGTGGGPFLRRSSVCALALPLQLGDERIGVLLLEADAPTAFGDRERSLAPALAREAAVAIHRMRLFDRIALAKREWEATFDAMTDGVVLLNRDRRVVRANQAGAALFGTTMSAVLGAPCCALFCLPGACSTARALASGEAVTKTGGLKTGAAVGIAVSPIRNRAGETTGAVAVLRAGGRAAAPGAALEARVGLALVESAEAALFVDRAASVVWVNRAAESLFGPSLEPLAVLSTLVAERDRARVQAAFARALTGDAGSVETHVATDGREIVLSFSPPLGDDAPEAVLVLAHDSAAERHQMQIVSQAERLRSLTTFARGVSRELVSAVAALEARIATDPEAAGAELARRAIPVLERLHALGRLRRDTVTEPLDLNHIVQDAIEAARNEWETAARARGAVYDVRFEPRGAPMVVGSAAELCAVFEELIQNALDAQPTGGRIEVKVVERQGLAAVQVSDSGPGMAEEVRHRCFDPFFTTRRDGALGLGLATALAAVLRHGGRVTVKSAPGEGAAVTVLLPLRDAAHVLATGEPERVAYVLVRVPVSRLRVFSALEGLGLHPILARDARELGRAIRSHMPAAIVLDAVAAYDYGPELGPLLEALPGSVAVALVENASLPDGHPLTSRSGALRIDPVRIEEGLDGLVS